MISLSRRGLLAGLGAVVALAALPVRAVVKWWRREERFEFGVTSTLWRVPPEVEAAERELLAKLLRDDAGCWPSC